MQRGPSLLQMHQMPAAAELDVALQRRTAYRTKQPFRILIRAQAVPLTAQNRDRRADQRRVIGERPRPGFADLLQWPGRHLHRWRVACPALRVAVEIPLRPISEVAIEEDRGLVF